MTVPPIYVQQKNQICKDEVETVSVYPQLSILQKVSTKKWCWLIRSTCSTVVGKCIFKVSLNIQSLRK